MSQAGAFSGHRQPGGTRLSSFLFLFSALYSTGAAYIGAGIIVYFTVFIAFLGKVPPGVYWGALLVAFLLHHAVTITTAIYFAKRQEISASLTLAIVVAGMLLAFYPLVWGLMGASVCNKDGCYGSGSEPVHFVEKISAPAIYFFEAIAFVNESLD